MLDNKKTCMNKEFQSISSMKMFLDNAYIHGNMVVYLFLATFSAFLATEHGCNSPRGMSCQCYNIKTAILDYTM